MWGEKEEKEATAHPRKPVDLFRQHIGASQKKGIF